MKILRQLRLMTILAATVFTCHANAAEIAVPPPVSNRITPVQQNQPNCLRWTDDCVNCTRGSNGNRPTCSNIGFACQPNSIRCLGSDIPQGERRH